MASLSTSSLPASPHLQFLCQCSIGGISCGIASTLTNPLDVIRIRMQSQTDGHYPGMIRGIQSTFSGEGLRGLTRGLYASWTREITYSSARIGLYDPIRQALVDGETDSTKVGTHVKFLAGFLSGSLGSAACNPCDLVKTRQQAVAEQAPAMRALESNWARHSLELRTLWREGGAAGLYKGWQATSARAAMLTSAQIGSYDAVKNNLFINRCGMREGVGLHFATALVAAVFTTTASNPFDVVKTRYMCDSTKKYSGLLDCASQTLRKEGPMAFMKGWIPAWTRVSPHTVITMIIVEKFRKALGIRAL